MTRNTTVGDGISEVDSINVSFPNSKNFNNFANTKHNDNLAIFTEKSTISINYFGKQIFLHHLFSTIYL